MHYISRPQNNLNLTQTLKIAYFFAPKSQKEITLKLHKIKSKNWRRQRKHMLFCYMSKPKHILDHNPNPKKAQFLPLFSVNLSQPQLNSISTKLRLNLMSTSFQPQPQIKLSLKLTSASKQHQPQVNISLNINLNSTSTITSTQYDCDTKATQSCIWNWLLVTDFKLANLHVY